MIVTLDYETHFSKEYSLKKMSEVEYILDERFQPILMGLKEGDAPVEILVGGGDIAARLAAIDWPDTALLSHNTRFDGAILAWVFGHYPRMYLDSLSMSRATTHWHIGRSSLAKVSEFLGLPAKGDELLRAQGKRLEDFLPEELEAFGCYCARDTQNSYDIFQKLRPAFTAKELVLIDLIMRMFIQPQVKLNTAVLEENYQRVLADKEAAMAQVDELPKEVFASNLQFAALLWDHGVDVPIKKSPTTGIEIPAVARNDWQFKELCMDESLPPLVQAMLAARLAVKSTLEETRSRNFLRLSRLDWPYGRGWAPVPLKYSGARTHRLSGDGGNNWQNLTRGSLLRQAVEAPKGWRIVHRDASQIEARMTAWMAKCDSLLDAFRTERDVYCEFASTVYGKPVTRDDKLERFVGKTSILGLGYGCGFARFRQMLFIGSGGLSLKVEPEEAEDIVDTYRRAYPEIPSLWRHTGSLLATIARFSRKLNRKDEGYYSNEKYDHIPVEPDYDSLLLPSGLRIYYPNLRQEEDGLVYDNAVYKSPNKIYGAKGVENISQALARIIVTDIAVQMWERTGYHPFLTTHDSLDYCVPASEAAALDAELEQHFRTVPAWAAGLPLASEGGWGRNLAAAERMAND